MEQNNPSQRGFGTMDRRSFLRLSGLLGVGLASSVGIPFTSEAVQLNRKMVKVSKTTLSMGSFVAMTLIHPSKDQAQEAMALAFEEIDRLNGIMSRFDQATAVAHLNAEGVLKGVPSEMAQVVERSLWYYQRTEGYFDISVKPVVDLFRAKFEADKAVPPTDADIEKVLPCVGADGIEVRGQTIRFKRPGMGITLDGIAVGYIVDQAAKRLTERGIENYLINAGGDIRVQGCRQDQKPWTIAVQDPEKKGRYPDVVHLTSGAISTSGNYEAYFDKEKVFHHIVDPRTGFSPLSNSSVSIVAPTTMDADALATAVFVMSPERGTRFVEGLGTCQSLIITRGGQQFRSAGWKGMAT